MRKMSYLFGSVLINFFLDLEGERGGRVEVVEPVANVARAMEDLRRNERESGF